METTASRTGPPLPRTVDDLTPAWLEPVLGLGPIAAVGAEPFGVGNVAQTVRIRVTWTVPGSQPATFVAKLASTDDAARRSAAAWRSYEVEAGFYAELAPYLPARTPRCYWSGFDPSTGACAIVLEDVTAGAPGDQLAGCEPASAVLALTELAGLHGARWADPALDRIGWLNRYPAGTADELGDRLRLVLPAFLDRYGGRLSPEVEQLAVRFVDRARYYDRKGHNGPRTISHGDYRNDNLLFGDDRVWILDWQSVHLGAAFHDVGYFLGGAVTTEDRRRCERDLLRRYWEELRSFGIPLGWDACWEEYRRHAFGGLTVAILSAGALRLSARADALLLVMAERAGWHALDLEAEDLLCTPSR